MSKSEAFDVCFLWHTAWAAKALERVDQTGDCW